MATVTINQWCQLMANVTPKDRTSSHTWICEVNRQGKRAFEVLSQEQFDAFSKTHSRWDSSCKKLSLKEIIVLSNNVLTQIGRIRNFGAGETVLGVKSDAEFDLQMALNGDSFSREIQQKIEAEFERIKAKEATLKPIGLALNRMAFRAEYNRTEAKTKSLWGKIKWYIWSWFYDKRQEVAIVIKRIPSLKEASKSAVDSIQDRILLNMDLFEEAIGIPREQRVCNLLDDKITDKFPTPASVKKGWWTKYAPDKYRETVSKQAETYRSRVVGLLTIWESLLKFDVEVTKGSEQQPEPNKDQEAPTGPLLLTTK